MTRRNKTSETEQFTEAAKVAGEAPPDAGKTQPSTRELPPRPKTGLVQVFNDIANIVGADKAKRLLVEQYGTENPEDLKASQLMDAIDDLYGAE